MYLILVWCYEVIVLYALLFLFSLISKKEDKVIYIFIEHIPL